MKVNNKDIEITWGCFLEDGGLNTFLQRGKLKPRYEYSWPDRSGVDVDDDEILSYEPLDFSVPLIFHGATPVLVNTAIDSFVGEVSRPFALAVDDIGKNWTKVYLSDIGSEEIVGDEPFAVKIVFGFRYNWQL